MAKLDLRPGLLDQGLGNTSTDGWEKSLYLHPMRAVRSFLMIVDGIAG